MIDNLIEERWREFYLPYTFGELHTQPEDINSNNEGVELQPSAVNVETFGRDFDNLLQEELYSQQHKYTTEEI